MTTPARSRLTRPRLPEPRGPVSAGVVEALRSGGSPVTDGAEATADPYGEDLQLALYVLYELHYQGFAGAPADDSREWDPELLALRATLEQPFLAALRADAERPASAAAALDALLVEPAGHRPGSVSHHLRRTHRLPELREYAALRSLYHLKEADPHAWMIPRLRGRAKAGLAAVEYDEFGAGRAEDVHARLYAELMAELGLEAGLRPLPGRGPRRRPRHRQPDVALRAAPGAARRAGRPLRRRRGDLLPGSRRLADALRKAGAGPAAVRFYEEHVEADAVHEQVVRRDVVAGLLADEPELDADVAFGVAATSLLEDRLGALLLDAWTQDRSALLPGHHADAVARPA